MMRWGMLLAVLLMSGCTKEGSQDGDNDKAASPRPIGGKLVFDLEVTGVEAGKPQAQLQTNLPDGTELGSSLSGSVSGGRYFAQSSGIVREGRATFGPFSAKGRAMSAGEYELSVSAPLTIVQPQAVRAIVGENYSHFEGAKIVRTTGPVSGAIIEDQRTIVIP